MVIDKATENSNNERSKSW
uniref:Uncharacterized protein n=1 Tax=Rhizophora mucronata TaxID=61149 RepID=A0A2P2PW03_RHIMU